MKQFIKISTIAIHLFSLSGCSELGKDGNGKFKAFLLLRTSTGESREFYLGGYNTLTRCIAVLDNEVDSYERETNGKFFTNNEFTYGGFKTESLTVEHLITGAKCEEHRKPA